MSASWIETIYHDARFALRGFRKTPGFTAAAIAALALGIGANTAIFSVVSGVLLRPLPFPDPERLVQLSEIAPTTGSGPVMFSDITEWREHAASLETIVAYTNSGKNLQGVTEPEQINTVSAERGLFRMLGVEPMLGRAFRDNDPLDVVVVGAGFWRRHLGAGPSAVGSRIVLDGQSFTVIGIMPEGFQFPYRAMQTELWTPFELRPPYPRSRRAESVVARLRPSATPDSAQSELNVIARRLEAQFPETNKDRRALVTPLRDAVAGKARNSLLVLLGAVGLVLLVACANVANLLLARAAARSKEVSIRTALGAGRWRLIRQFLTESLMLALAGALAGFVAAIWGRNLILRLAADQIPRSAEIAFDWRVFAFLTLAAFATGIGFGLAPALAALRTDIQTGLKVAGQHGSAAPGRLRDALVVAEFALAFVLLTGAGLLLRAFLNLQSTDAGMAVENVLTAHLKVPRTSTAPGASAAYCGALEERVARIPGVQAAGFISLLPLQNWGWYGFFAIPGQPDAGPGRQPSAELRYVTPGYFRAAGIPVRNGRAFSERDTAQGPRVVLVNEALARRYFPNQDPVGRSIDRGAIIGVVADVRQLGLNRPPGPEIYYSIAQNFAQMQSTGMSLVVRAGIAPESLVPAVRAAVHEVDADQALFNVKTMKRVVADSLSDWTLNLWLLGIFAGLALTLSAAGIYGVMSYAVTLRTREFGIRMALGAGSRRAMAMVLGHGARLVGIGLAVGVCGALALTRLLRSLLFGVTATDPATFSATGAVLAMVALLACWVPARRATQVDPAIALRHE